MRVPPTTSRNIEAPAAAAARWAGAAVCVTALHAGILWMLLTRSPPTAESGEPAGAVLIELAPLPVAPEVQPREVAVGEQQQESVETPPSEETEEPEEPVEPEPLPEPEPPPLQPLELPKLEEVPKAEAVLPTRIEPPPEEKKEEEKKEEVREPPKPRKKPPPRRATVKQTSAPRPSQKRSRVTAARSAGTASSASIATWRGSIMSRLNRHKRHPDGNSRGTAAVSFTINRSGRVLSVRLTRSSGNPRLDREALALPRRASPLPPPPAGLRGTTFNLSTPVQFR